MIIPVIRKYSRYAAILIVGIVIVSAIFGDDDEEMMYFSVDSYYGGAQQVSPGAYYDTQGNYEYNSRYGGGSQYADGSWNHYSYAGGGAVGGTADGCVYTSVAGGWSNC